MNIEHRDAEDTEQRSRNRKKQRTAEYTEYAERETEESPFFVHFDYFAAPLFSATRMHLLAPEFDLLRPVATCDMNETKKLQSSLLNAEQSRISPVFRHRSSTEAGAGRAVSLGLKPSGQRSPTGSLVRRGARIG